MGFLTVSDTGTSRFIMSSGNRYIVERQMGSTSFAGVSSQFRVLEE